MTEESTAGGAPVAISVPPLDCGLQNGPIRGEIDAAIARVCDSGRFIHGPECQQFEAAIANYCGVPHAIGCASGSDALLLALMALGVGDGDEVILPSFTFFATAGAVWRLGARPVFVDIEPWSFNVDPGCVERAVTPATRAIIPVHLFGRCADMGAILAIARAHKIDVIEDAAQAIGAECGGRRAGSMGRLGCLSFYPTKNLGGFGDGGMVTTHDGDLAGQLRILRDHGQQPRYHHSVVGINSRLDSVQAAVLTVKLSQLDAWTRQRTESAERYARLFAEAGLAQVVGLPAIRGADRVVWNQYTIRVADTDRDALVEHLASNKISAAVYYPVPLHLQRCFESLGFGKNSLPATERAAREVLSLPIFPGLTARQQQAVVGQVAAFYARKKGPTRPVIKRPKMLDHGRVAGRTATE